MYVTELEIETLRCFEKEKMSLLYPGKADIPRHVLPNVNLLLGVNGAGKTTILEAIAIAALAPVLNNSGFVPYYLVRRPPGRRSKQQQNAGATATITARAIDGNGGNGATPPAGEDTLTVKIEWRAGSEWISHPSGPGPDADFADEANSSARFLAGYGTTRRVETAESVDPRSQKRRAPHYQRVAGLFEEYIALMPLGTWLLPLKSKRPGRFNELVSLIASLLPKGTRFSGKFDNLESLFVHQGVQLPFGALSDGYRAYIGLLCDLIYHLHSVCPARRKVTNLPGIVLIDDVDLQLHPEWQRVVVPKLAKAFPRLQFVITTHSPITAGTLHSTNVLILHSEKGASTVQASAHRLHGLNADQIAISPYFGLPTTRAEDQVEKLRAISEQAGDQGDPAKAIEYLNELAGAAPETE
jgi:hypothetical protein